MGMFYNAPERAGAWNMAEEKDLWATLLTLLPPQPTLVAENRRMGWYIVGNAANQWETALLDWMFHTSGISIQWICNSLSIKFTKEVYHDIPHTHIMV